LPGCKSSAVAPARDLAVATGLWPVKSGRYYYEAFWNGSQSRGYNKDAIQTEYEFK